MSYRLRYYDDSDYDSEEDDEPNIVIEIGTHEIHAGFAGDDTPRHILRTILSTKIINKIHNTYIGSDAYYKVSDNKYIQHPIKKGVIQNWNQMEKIIEYMFTQELKIQTEEHGIIIIEKPFRCIKNREKLVQIMFEEYNIPTLYIDYTAVASCIATGKNNGIVLDLGYDTTWSVPVYEGYALKTTSNKIDIGGKHITNYLMELLNNKISNFDLLHRQEIAIDIKHKLSFVALDCNEIKEEIPYRLPDGNVITIGIERTKCCEILFNPSVIYKTFDYNGIHKLLYHSILKLKTFDADSKYHLSNNIILSGGNSMFKGIEHRLKKDIVAYENLCETYTINGYLRSSMGKNEVIYKDVFNLLSKYWHSKIDIKNVIAPYGRKYLSWIGGSIFGSLPDIYEMCMFKYQYEEYGPNIAHRLFW